MKTPRTTCSLLVLLLTGLLVACGGSSTTTALPPTPTAKPSISKITITATDVSFALPDRIQAGLVDITVVNAGTRQHQAQFARLSEGVALEQLQAALKKGPTAAWSLAMPAGGIALIKPGQSQEMILDLAIGQYVLLDFTSGNDHLPYAEKGMLKSFLVTGPANETQTSPLRADVKVTLKDFSFGFVLPETIKSGLLTYQVTNLGTQPHEMVLLKLHPGKTWKDVMAYLQSLSGPLPGELIGGLGSIAPGKTAWMKMNLAPGTYLVLCFLPDKTSGIPHAQLGMVCSFTVQ